MTAIIAAGARALPRRAKAWVMPWANPRFSLGTQRDMAAVAAGKVAPSPSPSSTRAMISETKPPARPVNTVAPAQISPHTTSVRLAPNRSLTQPPMIWKTR
ncbi:hypothetical protein D3C87_1731760 [compost metagenome]